MSAGSLLQALKNKVQRRSKKCQHFMVILVLEELTIESPVAWKLDDVVVAITNSYERITVKPSAFARTNHAVWIVPTDVVTYISVGRYRAFNAWQYEEDHCIEVAIGDDKQKVQLATVNVNMEPYIRQSQSGMVRRVFRLDSRHLLVQGATLWGAVLWEPCPDRVAIEYPTVPENKGMMIGTEDVTTRKHNEEEQKKKKQKHQQHQRPCSLSSSSSSSDHNSSHSKERFCPCLACPCRKKKTLTVSTSLPTSSGNMTEDKAIPEGASDRGSVVNVKGEKSYMGCSATLCGSANNGKDCGCGLGEDEEKEKRKKKKKKKKTVGMEAACSGTGRCPVLQEGGSEGHVLGEDREATDFTTKVTLPGTSKNQAVRYSLQNFFKKFFHLNTREVPDHSDKCSEVPEALTVCRDRLPSAHERPSVDLSDPKYQREWQEAVAILEEEENGEEKKKESEIGERTWGRSTLTEEEKLLLERAKALPDITISTSYQPPRREKLATPLIRHTNAKKQRPGIHRTYNDHSLQRLVLSELC